MSAGVEVVIEGRGGREQYEVIKFDVSRRLPLVVMQ